MCIFLLNDLRELFFPPSLLPQGSTVRPPRRFTSPDHVRSHHFFAATDIDEVVADVYMYVTLAEYRRSGNEGAGVILPQHEDDGFSIMEKTEVDEIPLDLSMKRHRSSGEREKNRNGISSEDKFYEESKLGVVRDS